MIDAKTTTVCCCANPVCLEKGCQLQAYQTFHSVDIKYVPVTVPDERKAIVKWLRRNPGVSRAPECVTAMTLFEVADAIERCEHLKGEDR